MAEWEAFCQIEPAGPDRTDIMLAQLASLMANQMRSPQKKRSPFEPRDFLPYRAPEQKAPLKDRLISAFKQLGGRRGQ